jgi:predicted RNA-binding Zn ribbon-like protein
MKRMSTSAQTHEEWIDGFLFVANRPILDLLNTKPVLETGPTELLPNFHAFERWMHASRMAESTKTKRLLRNWRQLPEAESFLQELIRFRERLRESVIRMESGALPSDDFVCEVNAGLQRYPSPWTLREDNGRIIRERLFEPRKPEDLWAPIFEETADLLSEPDIHRLRKCEACVVHFFDTSKKGSRRWCSMNICGNKLKVAAYQRRKRDIDAD